jgi:mRNA-degrading endonuclease YafQ of YafQ-DinJ toxin-antitoxin module
MNRAGASLGCQAVNLSTSNTGGGQSHDHTLSANFSGSANSVLQPYLVLIYIIKT